MEVRSRKSAKQYYEDPLLQNLLEAIFNKYRGQNGVRGKVNVSVASIDEAIRLQEFFGGRLERLIRPGSTIELHLKVFAEEIAQGYKLNIPELYEVLNNVPLVTNSERRQLQEHAWHTLFEQANNRFANYMGLSASNLKLEESTFNWLQRLHDGVAPGYRIVQHTMRTNTEDSVEIIFHCLKALWYLFVEDDKMLQDIGSSVPWVPLQIFAEFITERDPHAFDKEFPAGRLLWHALDHIHTEQLKSGRITGNEHLLVPDFMKRRYIYRVSGILADDVSSYMHVFIPDEFYGITARTLNLNELHSSQNWFKPADLYIFENPSVFLFLVNETIHFFETNGIVLEQIPDCFPILVCPSGRARDACKYFIYQLLEFNPDCTIHYSGDFDLSGLQMKVNLEALGDIQVMRMDAVTYNEHVHPQNQSLTQQDVTILGGMRGDLPKAMAKQKKKVYQEEITKELREDWIQVIKKVLKC
ncbi:TIGR02679 domain-containing protein [Paenibacillus pasadenensis]|uniref:TIGR02679 domain-containing protein n=1 Tax=Paenibacillus pasadenensis TaxID=217090 RepID=UPI00203A4C05|nr:TIGR02679 domain-containing protein [Paenibacillus pasadenensis]MCM3749257.1 TIGR02679 domain-containing protein [Paenibacillus pasadenensis]